MKLLHFNYNMGIYFEDAVRDHRFTLKCLPKNTERQRVESLSYKVFPNRFIRCSEDSFGNDSIYGFCEDIHNSFIVEAEGTVRTGYVSEDLIASERARENSFGIYKYQTPHTAAGPSISGYHDSLCERLFSCDGYEQANFYMHNLWKDYAYTPGSTDITTTAEEALKMGHGVCQDYAHILLSLCRMDHIPCRYVVGMLMGEGLSHAWVEIWSEGIWKAIDPTHDRVVGDDYIRVSVGRDYKDCLLNQGVFTGIARRVKQNQVIKITVENAESEIQS